MVEIIVMIAVVFFVSVCVLAFMFYNKSKELNQALDTERGARQILNDSFIEKSTQLKMKVDEQNWTITQQANEIRTTREEKDKILSQKKSSEVRLGKDAEVLAPFLEEFKWNPKDSKFIGDPIDYVIFEEDKINFVEVKSGNARLTTKQNNIKKLIESGKVLFHLLRVKGEECESS